MRLRFPLLALVTLSAACTGWLFDWTGTLCDDANPCGGGLVCVEGACAKPPAAAPDASTADDASVPADAGHNDAGQVDAGHPDSGYDAGFISPPTTECRPSTDWCQAKLPTRTGAWPRLTSVSGYRDDDIWVGGLGPTLLHWDGYTWTDFSAAVVRDAQAQAPPAPTSDLTSVVAGSYFLYAGYDGTLGKSACGWLSSPVPSPSFYYQDYCSGAATRWLGATGPRDSDSCLLVGTGGFLYAYATGQNVNNPYKDPSAPPGVDYTSAHFRNTNEMWVAGTAGTLHYTPNLPGGWDRTFDATAAGFPQTAADLFAVLTTGDAVFAGGAGTLYECMRTGADGHPLLSECANSAPAGTLRAFSGSSRSDVWAAGSDGTSPLLLKRIGVGQWQPVALTGGAPLYGIWRLKSLVLVVGDDGTLLSKIDP